MAKAIGFGGAFVRARDPKALYAWYEQHLGLKSQGCFIFPAKEQQADTVVSFFGKDDGYFPTQQPAMLNFQVDDLDAILDALIAAGVEVDQKRETYEYGRFGWFMDPEGNRVELWQPSTA
ncbi:VOC family protein [Alloacidobacterium sp.]|uniref:VOC family protein n=1 Tax=Alloacidobacterium sp. TaxID=2951999 RepID=UPI002D3D1D23|nr:VOC family protein [Alloacidobacterium sp.]HYK34349.1 VOC family protein [Alloacidobacterium sp.]